MNSPPLGREVLRRTYEIGRFRSVAVTIVAGFASLLFAMSPKATIQAWLDVSSAPELTLVRGLLLVGGLIWFALSRIAAWRFLRGIDRPPMGYRRLPDSVARIDLACGLEYVGALTPGLAVSGAGGGIATFAWFPLFALLAVALFRRWAWWIRTAQAMGFDMDAPVEQPLPEPYRAAVSSVESDDGLDS
ncbi:hypothetical protein FDZ71_00535 [bacterium]|nr:MAG: hypothetical protein FDZ71_00535 [bacterium]